ncbi:hypothetical protein [Nonomuraea sp. NPDC049400]|uniref:hypothetical protein n=1 Tax=Nonomuraea sp. NPDC049400 TaxID=3364352 RepID=UPI0037B4540A
MVDPKNRLAHGRVAQATLVALMVCVANLHMLASWRQTTDRRPVAHTAATLASGQSSSPLPPARSRPPPASR